MSDDKVTKSTEAADSLVEQDLEQTTGGALPEKELSKVAAGCVTGNYLKKIQQD
jgi:hypothetical protein